MFYAARLRKRGQTPIAGTALRVLRTIGAWPRFRIWGLAPFSKDTLLLKVL